METAVKRLDILSRQLSKPEKSLSDIENQKARPAPGGGPGTLTVRDNRTGKEYEVEISDHGTVRASDLKKITAGGGGEGLRLYDPGYLNTAPVKSRICYIEGDRGILRYRGIPIEQLAEKSTFLETSYLLLYGSLPVRSELEAFEAAVARHSALPEPVAACLEQLPHTAHPMSVVIAGLAALGAHHPEQNPAVAGGSIYSSAEVRDKQIVRLLGKVPALAAYAYHRCTGRRPSRPNANLGYAANFLYMLDSMGSQDYKPNPRLARALDVMFILHAEHEMNCSTAAMRHLASSGVDVYIAAAGAVGALYGPLHGGANEAVLRMLTRIGSVDGIPSFLDDVKAKKEKLFGFGHRVYKNFDPRATQIRQVAEEVFAIAGRDPLIDVANELERIARSDPYFIDRKLYPNVDFYSGLVYRAMGFPPEFFTVLFAIPRTAGYLAHWRESLDDPDTKILRPQQDYRGEWLQDYLPITDRQLPARGTAFANLPISHASQRRMVGRDWS
uniref:Citrate synthase n=1 Tax=Tetraselmis sp. GSL018 TaxID=582737 RepID=A0A061QZK6_9CHLO|mmetsp:Transcript_718/g.1721  ORF Transcript_718/g.1721 Transcript_718/m.1721 type:complete len:500 (+) Transcript_718:161-1660(+)|eukprot:CAMPEP_0177601804 /NCGR_PEP_ID=MMETSP0419_2-20121207/14482_1 /TAXON_ID=582737 /ORGANISM="Tetraselmis sp., Strain GSL018" /LENGTH=499 /DNA_ID=CAMNT_0019095149 /DNA_START=120 /DNA_END=1619 /DNA_ORIENTATION=+